MHKIIVGAASLDVLGDIKLEQIHPDSGSRVEDKEEEEVWSGSEESSSEEEGIIMETVKMSFRNWLNVVLLGFGFLLLFTAFQTTAFIQVMWM